MLTSSLEVRIANSSFNNFGMELKLGNKMLFVQWGNLLSKGGGIKNNGSAVGTGQRTKHLLYVVPRIAKYWGLGKLKFLFLVGIMVSCQS